MGRPEPYVLFAQTILHSQLDEYVDEVIFAEPVVITACEFLEQNASPSTPSISLIGATSPPSFALEVFVHCEGESRFRRLCQPFLYSHSSSNVLEVEAIVTNHLVLRGSYRSLTLVVYGNTAEDLGQFNIEVDLDNSLTNVVCSPSEGRLEDLPLALHSSELAFEESVSSLKSLGFRSPEFDILPEVKQFLLLAFKICQLVDTNDMASNVVSAVESVASSCAVVNTDSALHSWDQELLSALVGSKRDSQKFLNVLVDARNELLEIWKNLQSENGSCELMEDELETQLPTTEMLVDMFYQCFPFFRKASTLDLPFFSQSKNLVFALGLILLVCSSREGCSHFVSGGGMDQIIHLLHREIPKSTATTLLLLLIIECATRHGIGCESFLGWWPRRDFVVPFRVSDGYCYLLELLLEKQRHDIASLSTYVLHRLRFFEILSRYESAVVFLLTNLPADGQLATDGVTSLVDANSQLKHILKSINSYGPIEDPSPGFFVRRISNLGNTEDLLSYKATVNFIATSKYSFARSDFDPYLLSLLKERGFFPLSAALLSSATLRSASGSAADSFLEIATSLELILLSFLFCRSGLSFLLVQPEATELLILAFQDGEDISKTECMTLRQATVLLSKGFFCRPQEVGMIIELYLRVVTAVSRLLAAAPNSDEFLWVLWELCAISRTDTGRKALLALGYFPEALSVLLEALRSYKDLEQTAITSVVIGASPLSSAILHSAAEIFEVMVADSAASSLKSWIGLAVELHKALHLSSPGSNRQDAPTRLLKWVDAGVIYHKNGTIGLLQYAAILASGGDAHLSSSSILVSDSIDVENVFGDSTSSSDGQVIDNLLGKLVSDKYFDGVPLTSTSIVQLTTALRILAYISEDSAVAATLFEEGAVTLVYVVLVNCKSMLERWSNSYDYLVDEGAESSSTTDLLFGRSHEKRLLDLIIPSLVLLINLLRKLQETKEQYRNKKLLNALLQLHREVSPRLAACAADLSFLYPSPALGHGAICHLITSAVASWPIFGWAPGLFHSLLENIQATSSAALGPKDVCSLLSLLGYLFPDEGIWLWKNEMPPLSAVRALSIATVLGPQVERQINWATSPPSFALEVFVHCEGESRFRRLCQPFLYSHSSSNVLEVEVRPLLPNHLVLRGSYRSLTLVVYGNTAEDLGQFNIEVDLDNSLTNVVCSPSEGRLEDLPLALHSSELAFEESVSSLKSLGFRSPEFDILPEVKQFLLLAFKICQLVDTNDMASNVVSAVESVASLCAVVNTDSALHSWDQELLSALVGSKRDSPKFLNVLADARNELLEIWKNLQSENGSCELMEDELETQLPTTEMLVDMFYQCFPFFRKASTLDLPFFSQSKNLVFALGLILLVCSSREGCSHFVSGGGMDQIIHLLHREIPKSTATTLLLLLIIECATRHGIGCESFLGWWPRRDFVVPFRVSDGYCYLLELLLEKQRHDIASLSTYVLHRLRFFEILSRYESAVVFLLTNLPADGQLATDGVTSLVDANSQLKHILKSINSYGPIEDPSPGFFVRRISNLGNTEDLLSYKATVNFIATSKYSFARSDFDPYLLSLLKERGFFPLSAALLSSATLRSASGSAADSFLEIATSLELILLSFLFCRSGLSFLLVQPEATELLILAFQDGEDISKTECMTLRQATVLLSKGFFCRPQEVGMIIELYLRVVTAVSRLLAAAPNSDEFLWVLWELCAISRTDTGRKALLALGYFPEALSVLLEALRSYKDLEQTAITSVVIGASPLSSAILHSAAEIFEVMVADSAASSLKSWIGLAVELHKALHLSSPGSNRQDAPTRLLKWIDAGVIYHKNGTIGLLQYAAILASGGDAHLSSSSILVSDSIDVENVFGDSTSSSDGQVIDNLLGKLVSDKYFDGVTLTSTSIVQLTTALRILAYISEDSAVAATLFEEGAVTLVYVVLVNCKSMLERWSNSYDYLVDEGAESSSTTDLLFGRSHEKRLLDLIIPSLATSSAALGPKDVCSLLSLLGYLFPDEGIWLWKNEMPPLSAVRALSIATVLGPQVERQINWYLEPEHSSLLLIRLTPQLDKIAQVVLHYATSGLVVIQDMLRVLIARIASQRAECAVVLLRPTISWLDNHVDESSLSDTDIFKVHQLLHFIASLLEHPNSTALLSKMGTVRILGKVLEICSNAFYSEGKVTRESRGSSRNNILLSWSLPAFKSLALIFNAQSSPKQIAVHDECLNENISLEESSLIVRHLLKLCQVNNAFMVLLGTTSWKELLACAMAFKELVSSKQGRSSLSVIYSQALGPNQELEQDERDTDENYSNEYSWLQSLPFLKCWKKLLRSLDSNDSCANFVVETVYVLSLSAVCLSLEGDSVEGINILKYLFGLPCEPGGAADISDEKLNEVVNLLKTLEGNIAENENSTAIVGKSALDHVNESLKAVSLLLHSTSASLSNSQLAKFVWECSDSSLGKHLLPAQSAKRRLPPGDGSSKRTRDAAGSEATTLNVFSRGVNAQNAPAGPTRRDTFRQRKPNTSRPPSMHVDDYVARERNIDGASSGSNIVNTNQRGGSISGRPPSIHVDEFMARQRERQNSIPTLAAGDASQPKSLDLLNNSGPPKPDQPQKLRADLDDDEIDIVFDEESGSDDKLPFPQPEENLPSPTVVVVKSSPGSVVEESEGDRNGNVRFNQIGSTPQASRSQISTTQELSVPSEKNTSLRDRSESNYSSQPSTNIAGFPSPFSNARSSAPLPIQQFSSSYLYQGKSPQKEQTLGNAQPPLPPTPPPAAVVSSPFVNTSRDVQPPLPTGYPLQAFDVGGPNNVAGLQLQSENMLSTGNGSWNSITGSRMHLPPLPPPPYSTPITHSPALHSGSPASLYNQSTSNVGTLTLPTPSLISDTGLGILPASGNNSLSAYSYHHSCHHC
uniref:Virilizer N-terminal domain-containing protein n=1 Tax=Ananas comosus var. bracteatus TaxID=296719 RepID=A0A6V7PR43_ANACO|nr:unnamed protein product [Ananas comosus var. bracteatus]